VTPLASATVGGNGTLAESLSIDDVTVTEGNTGTAAATFTVTLSASNPDPVTVDYATANDSAVEPGDYASASGQLTFAIGETTKTVTVDVNGDTLDEANENFDVNLTNATGGATIADGQGVGTINDDDAAPSVSIDDDAVTEGNSGTTNSVFTATLSAASGQTVTVDYSTLDGTATAGADYVSATGQLTFPPGQTSKTATVTVNGDLLNEVNENYTVNLSSPSNVTIADGSGLGTTSPSPRATRAPSLRLSRSA
jgi:Calx-beta domain-containing protein